MSAAIKPFHFLPGNCQERLLLCDHASCEIPVELAELGLSQTDRRRHIAWDIGAKEVAWALAEKLDCPAFFGGVSRLVADLNRAPDSAEMVMRESDGGIVPGNCSLSDEARGQRISQWHAPYHHAIAHHLQTCLGRGCRPIILSPSTASTPNCMGSRVPGLSGCYDGKRRPGWRHCSINFGNKA